MGEINENDVVEFFANRPDAGLRRGDVGTVIHVFGATADYQCGFMVEFLNESQTEQVQLDITDPSLVLKLLFRSDSEGI